MGTNQEVLRFNNLFILFGFIKNFLIVFICCISKWIYMSYIWISWLNFYLQYMIKINHDQLEYIRLFLVYLALHKLICPNICCKHRITTIWIFIYVCIFNWFHLIKITNCNNMMTTKYFLTTKYFMQMLINFVKYMTSNC